MKDCKLSWFNLKGYARMVLFLTMICLLQQFSFASLHHLLSDTNSSFLHYAEKHPSPKSGHNINIDIEVEVPEEDEVDHADEHDSFAATDYHTIGDPLYHLSANSLYLTQAAAIHRQSGRPLFMLHHSWKAHLS